MTPKEAIEKAIRHFRCVRDDAQVVLDSGFGTHEGESDSVYRNRKMYAELAIEALEKQIPKKPINQSEEYDRTYGNCPCCGEMVVDYPDDFRVCSNCGQVIDWGEEE